jgi:hypothetical protein
MVNDSDPDDLGATTPVPNSIPLPAETAKLFASRPASATAATLIAAHAASLSEFKRGGDIPALSSAGPSTGKSPAAGSELNPFPDLAADQSASRTTRKAAGQSSAIAESETSTLVSGESSRAAVADPTPASLSQNLNLQSAMVGAVTQNKTYSDLLKDSTSEQSASDLSAASSQSATKTGTSDKASLSQQNAGRDSHATGPSQAFAFDSGQVTQMTAGKADISVGQNAPAQAAPISGSGIANVVSTTPNDHSPADGNNAVAPGTDETLSPQDVIPTFQLGSVQKARLVQNLSDTELRMGIQAGEFGKVDIRASINQGQISARIFVEHNELGKALAETLPQLHEKLSVEHRVDAQIQFYNTGSSHSNGADRQPHQQQQGTQEQNGTALQDADDFPLADTTQEPSGIATTKGLDMQA